MAELGNDGDRPAQIPGGGAENTNGTLREALSACEVEVDVDVPLSPRGDNALFVRLLQEDGTRAWTSPVYVFR